MTEMTDEKFFEFVADKLLKNLKSALQEPLSKALHELEKQRDRDRDSITVPIIVVNHASNHYIIALDSLSRILGLQDNHIYERTKLEVDELLGEKNILNICLAALDNSKETT